MMRHNDIHREASCACTVDHRLRILFSFYSSKGRLSRYIGVISLGEERGVFDGDPQTAATTVMLCRQHKERKLKNRNHKTSQVLDEVA